MTRLVAFLLALLSPLAASAETFPSHPVRIIVAFPAGGGTDIVARLVAQKLTEQWGQQVIVDNRAGAAGVIGTELAAAAPGDGYTLLIGTMGNLAVNPHLYAGMKAAPLRDFAPVTQLVNVTLGAMAYPGFAPNTIAELIALARAQPGQITYSSSGSGGAPHLAGELLKQTAKIDLLHVPYKGSGPSFQDLLAGQVSFTFDSLVQGLPHIKAGRLKALAVLDPKRSPLLPEVPTVGETVPGFELVNWFGMVAPAATPPDIVKKIAADAASAVRAGDLGEQLTKMAATPVGNTPEEFGAVLRADTEKWGRIVRDAHIRAE